MKMLSAKKLSALSLTAYVYLTAAVPTFAAAPEGLFGNLCPVNPTSGATKVMNFNPLCALSPENDNLIGNIFNVIFILAVILALAFLVYGGIKWITSGGDKTKVEGARNTIVAALIGLVITFLAYFILQVIFGLFGLRFEGGNFWASLNLFGN